MLEETAARILERNAQAPILRNAILEAGLLLALAGEDAGGLGVSYREASAIAYRWGQAAAPLPIVEMLVAAPLAVLAGFDATAATYSAGLGVNDLLPSSVPVFDEAQTAFVVTLETSGANLHTGTIGGAAAESLAHEPMAALGASRKIDADPVAVERIAVGGILLQAAEMLGAMSTVIDIATDHANTRQQFGRPLGKFQAIQHMLSDAASERLIAEAAVGAALAGIDRGTATRLDWLAAKAQAARAATVIAANAHQVMGAIGFTDEHHLHRFTKRLWAWRDRWGAQGWCEAEIGRIGCAAGGDGLWSAIVDRAAA
ncbi:acyl-CoA dehydrogenase family protein [Aquamicrobium sp. LC103]|uniref:acyl-CoA dehydrogenase family protein n=1 Tax=Aquamicrobium sp. LC103 TaxID=1120658 RepID=UPI000AACBD5E|nr:acyl-CoA dehydrogenase family protein [Aquamicrobium sp. LC103]